MCPTAAKLVSSPTTRPEENWPVDQSYNVGDESATFEYESANPLWIRFYHCPTKGDKVINSDVPSTVNADSRSTEAGPHRRLRQARRLTHLHLMMGQDNKSYVTDLCCFVLSKKYYWGPDLGDLVTSCSYGEKVSQNGKVCVLLLSLWEGMYLEGLQNNTFAKAQ